MIGDVIDFSCEQEGMLVQQGVCQELDELKATYHALPDFLTQVCSHSTLLGACCIHGDAIAMVKAVRPSM